MSTHGVDYLHIRLREELERFNISAAEASRMAGEKSGNRIREVLTGRQRLSAELLARLVVSCNIDANYVLTGQRETGLSVDSVKAALQMVADAEAGLPDGNFLLDTERIDAICAILKTAQSLGHIPDKSAAIAVLMSMR